LCAQFKLSEKTILHGKVTLGEGTTVQANVISGSAEDGELDVGKDCTIRSGTVIYSGVKIGDSFRSGHNVLIRENTKIGDNVLVGTSSDMKYGVTLKGPVIKQRARIGANSAIMPGITIGEGAIVGASSVVTKDVPSYKVVMGVPAKVVKDAPRGRVVR